jgi:uncharacterized Fe-S center protein
MKPTVYFADMVAHDEKHSLPAKVDRLCRKLNVKEAFGKDELVAIKLHFGEMGNTTYLRPELLQNIIDAVRSSGAKPFLTDCNTLYKGGRTNAVDHLWCAARHGFTYPVADCPVIIADGLRGKDEKIVHVNLKHCKTVKLGSAAMQADGMMVVSHVKGHDMTGMGGALKNVGMGLGSRAGKMEMHNEVNPQVNAEQCTGCGTCRKHCPADAITINEKAVIDHTKCIGCGDCMSLCSNDAVWGGSAASETVMEKIVEYAYGAMKGREKKFLFISFLMDITPNCDCFNFSDEKMHPDVGVLASTDIVAIDQAAADLVIQTKDVFRHRHKLHYQRQMEYAEELGLGSRDYDLQKLP